MQPGTVEKCCHSFLKVNVNRPVAAVEFRSATWISVATGTFEDAAGPANRDLRRKDSKGRSIQQYADFGYTSSESIILVPTRQIQGPSVSTKFYLSTIKNQSTPLKVTVYSPIPQAFHLGDTSIPVSDRMQIFELPYEPGMNVIRVDVSISDCPQGQDSTWLFGAGGIQTQIGMNFRSGGDQRGLLCGEREWFYSRGEFDSKPNSSFYLVVPAHSQAGIIHVETEQVRYLCNPILVCNGNGRCAADGTCDCLEGNGYSFSGDHCEKADVGLSWVLFVVIVIVLAFLYATYLVLFAVRSRPNAIHPDILLQEDSLGLSPPSVSICLKNVSLQLDSGKNLLTNVSAEIGSGEFTALMGPSGSGKSTLLKVMNGMLLHTEGQVLFNGIDIRKLRDRTSLLAYVPQDDILRPALTVYETLYYSASLRLPTSYSSQQKSKIVDFVLECVGLVTQKDMLVGDIGASQLSGGQRKRVSIAQELISFPSVLFLDEPTSGLDSAAALSLVSMLRLEIVKKLGITVCCVIHQPRYDILLQFDKVLVLQAGILMYSGKPHVQKLMEKLPPLRSKTTEAKDDVEIFFNPADFILDHVASFQDANKEEVQPDVRDISIPTKQPFLNQLWIQSRRSALEIFRNYRELLTLYGLTALVSLLLSVLYQSSRFAGPAPQTDIHKCPDTFKVLCASNRQDDFVGQASIISLALGLTSAASSLTVFGGIQKKVYARESTSGASNLAYLLAKEITALPNLLLAGLLFVSIFQSMTSSPISTVTFAIVVFGIFFSCSGAAFLFSVLTTESISLILTVVYVSVMTSVSGAQPSLPQLKKVFGGFFGRLMPALSYARYSTEGFYLGVLKTFEGIYDLTWSFEVREYSFDHTTFCLVAPFAIGLLFRILSGLALLHGSSIARWFAKKRKTVPHKS